jgi:DNA-binding transcriptional MerR regulator
MLNYLKSVGYILELSMIRPASFFTIGEIAEQLNVKTSVIRFYEDCGLLGNVPRTKSGRRYYSEELLERLVFIFKIRDLGFGIEETSILVKSIFDKENLTDLNNPLLECLKTLEQKAEFAYELRNKVLRAAGKCQSRCNVHRCGVIRELE